MTTEKRGIVLSPADFSWPGWMDAIERAGLNYLGIHSSLGAVVEFLESAVGQRLLREAEPRGIDVNFEMHVMGELLPRELFADAPAMFRMNDAGARTPDANLCVSSHGALAIAQQNALKCAARLRQFRRISRYYFWPHDNKPWCHCPPCRELSASDQALTLANALCESLRSEQPDAEVAYLAYTTTLEAPARVTPHRGVFLQYAPIGRSFEHALDDETCEKNCAHVAGLRRLCQRFEPGRAEVLEYWLDVSMFSHWRKPAVKLPFSEQIVRRDVAFYRAMGFERFSTFGVYIDAEYVRRFGSPPLEAYGRALAARQ
jgi:hypothetical protein